MFTLSVTLNECRLTKCKHYDNTQTNTVDAVPTAATDRRLLETAYPRMRSGAEVSSVASDGLQNYPSREVAGSQYPQKRKQIGANLFLFLFLVQPVF